VIAESQENELRILDRIIRQFRPAAEACDWGAKRIVAAAAAVREARLAKQRG
jgi:hypothetical protein